MDAPDGRWTDPAERAASGRARRTAASRSSHAELDLPSRDPVDILERQAATRVAELVPVRYGRMMASPFSFFRGAAAVMAHDLGAAPRTDLTAQLCGDAHLANFGVFGSPERRLVFDLNDFDETFPGPFEWDVKRLATSVVVAARDNGVRRSDRLAAVMACVGSYRQAMHEFAAMGNLAVWYARVDVDDLAARLGPPRRGSTRRELARARTRDSLQALEKLTTVVDGERRIVADPPLLVPMADLVSGVPLDEVVTRIERLMQRYRASLSPDRAALVGQYRLVDIARKVVGVGSVGTRAYVILMVGRDRGDPLVLQVKEAEASVLARHLDPQPALHQGRRVVVGQRMMQAVSDIFLGWHRAERFEGRRRDFYVRQLRDWKGAADLASMRPADLVAYGRLCGWTLARAHARSGDRIAIAAYLGSGPAFDTAVTAFAETYAEQNERDHAALAHAVSSGRVAAARG